MDEVYTFRWGTHCQCEECKQGDSRRWAWANGLGVNAQNFVFIKSGHQFKSRAELLAACKAGKLRPRLWVNCNYGKKTYNEIRKWLGLPKYNDPPTERQEMLTRIARLEAEVKRLKK